MPLWSSNTAAIVCRGSCVWKLGWSQLSVWLWHPALLFSDAAVGINANDRLLYFFSPLSHFCSCRREIERIQKMEGIQLHLRPLSTDTELHLYRQVVLMLHRLCPLCSLTPRTRFKKKTSQKYEEDGGEKKQNTFCAKVEQNVRVKYCLDNFIINAFLWRTAYLFCIRHLALKQHSSPHERQRLCKWLPSQDVLSRDYLNESIKNKTLDALFFIDLWQNLWGRSKVVVIDGAGLMRTAPETHLMLSS